jgi:anti-sigma-K factor RskA
VNGVRALVVVLLVFGFVAAFWRWIALALGTVVLFVALLWLAFFAARRVDDPYEKRAALVARADQQHAWVMADDDRGLYGEYRPYKI